jgi:hypothetical protein
MIACSLPVHLLLFTNKASTQRLEYVWVLVLISFFLPACLSVCLSVCLSGCVCLCVQDANKEGETPLSLAGDLAAALQEAASSGKVYTNGFGAMEH